MASIDLGYGHQLHQFDYDPDRFAVLAPHHSPAGALTDAEVNAALDSATDSPQLDDVLAPGDSVLIVCSDATRATGSAQIINLLVRRLIQNGTHPSDIAIIFATGIHRAVRPEEKVELLTAFIAQRIKTLNHDANDPAQMFEAGKMERGTPIEVNRALQEYAKVIVTGAVGFHYFAGFTGGRKSICPGLASARTIEATHMLALDFDRGGRRPGVGTALLDGNAVSEECERVAEIINPAFSINAIVDDHGHVEKVFAGHWRAAHRRACADYVASHSAQISDKRDVIIVSCGGAPYDINMIQAHKALDMAAHACADGGTIVFLAECGDGLGRADFLKWFDSENSRALENRLRDSYEVNGQTAWALLTKTERFRVQVVSDLSEEQTRAMRMTKVASIEEAMRNLSPNATGYIMPRGAALLPSVTEDLSQADRA
jgi:lactate racemase